MVQSILACQFQRTRLSVVVFIHFVSCSKMFFTLHRIITTILCYAVVHVAWATLFCGKWNFDLDL